MRIDLVMRGVLILLMGIYGIQNTDYKVVKKVNISLTFTKKKSLNFTSKKNLKLPSKKNESI